jgi:hypothetical protein
MPRVLTIVLSNSTSTATTTPSTLNYRHTVKFSKPTRTKQLKLIGYTAIKIVADTTNCIEVAFPFLTSHVIGGSYNNHAMGLNQAGASVSTTDIDRLNYDKRRHSSTAILLPVLTTETNAFGLYDCYSVSTGVIKSTISVALFSADTGMPYTNISTLILRFEID